VNLAWDDALWALAALHIDPVGLRGIWLRSPHGPVRDEWLTLLQHLRPGVRRLPNNIDSERLLGGLDLSATLNTGRPVTQAGLLAQSDQSLLLAPMAERMANEAAAILAQVLDSGRVTPHGGGDTQDARLGLIALDEALEDEPAMAETLQERLGIWLDLRHLGRQAQASDEVLGLIGVLCSPDEEADEERQNIIRRLRTLRLNDEQIQAITQMAQAMGIASLRGPLACVRLACVLAALRESDEVQDQDLGRAARLCLTPRATQMPAPPEQEAPPEQAQEPLEPQPETPEPPQDEPAPPDNEQPSDTEQPPDSPDSPEEDTPPQNMGELLLEAALASLPPDVLAQLAQSSKTQIRGGGQSRSGDVRQSRSRGSPLPPRPGLPRQGARLHVLATLGHAAPRQKLRTPLASSQGAANRLAIRAEDFHIHRFAERTQTCLIFAIDASGSAALHRLAEAKGAVELLLAQSYARRDQVCVVGFRGTQAEVLLPPTKSLVRAKRSLAGLLGGGGTPLPHAMKLALELALQQRRLGVTPSLVMLCDGRANVSLQGSGGRAQAFQESLSLANAWRSQGLQSIWIDTSARPEPQAEQLAQAMGAHYVPLPQANSQRMAQVVQAAPRHSEPDRAKLSN
jgi:magnesium chelatase subunit D